MKKIFNLWMLFLFSSGFSQTRVLLSSGSDINFQYLRYEDSYLLKPAERQEKNETIEAFMSSILGADNQNWVDSHELGGSKNAEQKTPAEFQQIRNRNKSKTYMRLISRLEIQASGQQFAIVKFKIFLEQAPNGISGAYQLQKVGDIWYKTALRHVPQGMSKLDKIGFPIRFYYF